MEESTTKKENNDIATAIAETARNIRGKKTESSGLVRKLDELGRIVIPKDIRKRMHIEKGDGVEYFIEGDTLCLRKYNSDSCTAFMNLILEMDQSGNKDIADTLKEVLSKYDERMKKL